MNKGDKYHVLEFVAEKQTFCFLFLEEKERDEWHSKITETISNLYSRFPHLQSIFLLSPPFSLLPLPPLFPSSFPLLFPSPSPSFPSPSLSSPFFFFFLPPSSFLPSFLPFPFFSFFP